MFEAREGGIFGIAVPVAEGDENASGEQSRGAVGKKRDGFFQLCVVVCGIVQFFQQVAAGLPFGEAAVSPLGEILLADGFVVEESGEDFVDLREAVEPGGEKTAREVLFEAVVEFVADGTGETGDFSGSVHSVMEVGFHTGRGIGLGVVK